MHTIYVYGFPDGEKKKGIAACVNCLNMDVKCEKKKKEIQFK